MSKKGKFTILILFVAGFFLVYLSHSEEKDLLGDLTSPIFKRSTEIEDEPKKEEKPSVSGDEDEDEVGMMATDFNDLQSNIAEEFNSLRNKTSSTYEKSQSRLVEFGENTREEAGSLVDNLTDNAKKRINRILLEDVCKDLEY